MHNIYCTNTVQQIQLREFPSVKEDFLLDNARVKCLNETRASIKDEC